MNMLLVDDNRDVLNWGCRATSISLYQLLSSIFRIQAIIDKTTVDTKVPIGLEFLNRRIIWRIRHYLLRTLIDKPGISQILRVFADYVQEDPKKSVTLLLKHKEHNPILHSIFEKIANADVVVINGEGSMIFTTPPRRDLLFQLMTIELCKYLGKPVFYVNAMVSDCPVFGRNFRTAMFAVESLEKCNGVALRDQYSLRLLRKLNSEIKCIFVPDALFSLCEYFTNSRAQLPENGDFLIPFPEENRFFGKFDFHAPYICISGSSLAAWTPDSAINRYSYLVDELSKLDIKLYLVETCSGDHFLRQVSDKTGTPLIPVNIPILMGGAILANAQLFISGRYHPSILASLGGTPCVFLGSNSHKTRSLQNCLNMNW